MASAAPSFSAYYAHKRAYRNAVRLSASQPQRVSCSYCAGTKIIRSSGKTLDGATGKWSEDQISEMPCPFCKDGKGDAVKQLYNKLVWCACKNRENSGFIHAADGRRVFGNDTYLCSHCGFVKQFG